ncbi:MAG: hypothetical protein GOVbin8609_57 [Prokaryotic dsDNA virus sp.]|nr:MAG: hypothetical protein GOVbin8609_57 [Prokaryotic dsDNA virus sp.]|tara:strand:+ start:14664 stop:14903 length:240 start_codon:yes stop_codon:yes gene_type:complete
MFEYTKEELQAIRQARLKELIEVAGGPTMLARIMGISINTVMGWHVRGQISKQGARLIPTLKNEAIKNRFSPEYLRPDL